MRDALRFEGCPEVLAISEGDDGGLLGGQTCWWKGSTALFGYRVGDEKFYVRGPASYSDIQWGDPLERYVSYVESDPSIARVGLVTQSDVLESTLALGLLAAILGLIISWLAFMLLSNLDGHPPGVAVVDPRPEPASTADTGRRLTQDVLLAVEPWMQARFWCLVACLLPLTLLSLYHDANHHRIRSMAFLGLAIAAVGLALSWLYFSTGKQQKKRFDAIRNGEYRWFWAPDPHGISVASEAMRQEMRWLLLRWAAIPLIVGITAAIAAGIYLWLSGHSAEYARSASFALSAVACCVVGTIYCVWWLASYTRRYAIQKKQLHAVFADDVLVFAGQSYQLRHYRTHRKFRLSQIDSVNLLNVELSQRHTKGDRRVFFSIPVPPGCESDVKEIQEFYRVGGHQAS